MAAGLITVAETAMFVRQANRVWTEAEREEFVLYIAGNPDSGDVIPETGGVARCDGEGQGQANAAVFG